MSVEQNNHNQKENSKNKSHKKSEETHVLGPVGYSGLGLMVGFTTFPIDKDTPNFFQKEIGELFKWYYENLDKSLADNTKNGLFDYCYKPKPYYIFGKFDLAFISIIDDYEICGRTFRPFNEGMRDIKSEYKNFDYKIIAGNFPERINQKETGKEIIIERAKKTFLEDKNKYPFISLCTVKINNILLLKYGYEKLNRIFQEYFFKNVHGSVEDNGIRVLLVETFGASEYLLLFFSNEYKKIANKILEIRNLVLPQIEDETSLFLEKAIHVSGYSFFEYTNSIFGFDYELFERNLIKPRLKEISDYIIKDHGPQFSIPDNDFLLPPKYEFNDWDKDEKKYFDTPEYEELISLNTRWFVKPSYSNRIDFFDHKFEKNEYARIASGLGDIIPHSRRYMPLSQALTGLINEYKEVLQKFKDGIFEEGCIVESRSNPVFKVVIKNQVEDIKSTLDNFNKNKKNWILDTEKDFAIQEKLKQLGVAKIVRNKVAKVLSNYNNLAYNTLLFLYLLDITDYVKNTFYKTISNPLIKLNELNYFLKEKMIALETAYYNRFFQSSVTKEITDFNSEYFGAIHQTISAFSLAYNVYARLFGNGDFTDIVTVESHPRIESSKYFVRVNYFHVFQPEIFSAICCHEATNFFYDKMDEKSWDNFEGLNESILKNEYGFKSEQFTNFKTDKKYIPIKINRNVLNSLESEEDFYLYEDFCNQYLKEEMNIFKSFSKDLITLYTGFFGDKDLFETWHWNYFLQMSMNYDSENKINEKKFCIFLIRILFVLSTTKTKDEKKEYICYYDEYKFKNPLRAPNRILQALWLKYYPKARWLVKKMLLLNFDKEYSSPTGFKTIFKNWGKQLAVYGFDKMNFKSYDYKKSYSDYFEKPVSKEIEFSFYNETISELKQGIVVEKSEEIPESDYYFVTKLIYSFLKYYQTEIWLDNTKEVLLPRENGAVKEDLSTEKFFDVLLDRQGGLFSFNFERRQELFKMRAAFIKSLWNVNLIAKGKEFLTENN